MRFPFFVACLIGFRRTLLLVLLLTALAIAQRHVAELRRVVPLPMRFTPQHVRG